MSSSSRSTLPVTDVPGITSCMRLSARRNVDLPQPDGPMSAVTVFGSMVMVTPSTAAFEPYDAVRSMTSNRFAIAFVIPLPCQRVAPSQQSGSHVEDDNDRDEREGTGPSAFD